MGVVQISNYVIPLITLPYLTRVLGAESFGKVAFAQVVMAYFVLLVDFGFSWSATRNVAANRNNPKEINRIFAATWAAQWFLVLIAALVAFVLVTLIDRLRPDAPLYAAGFITVIATALFPVWFLQGVERLQVVAVLQLITRSIGVLPIFLIVQQANDAIWVLIIQGGFAMMAGVLSLWWMHRQALVEWCRPSWREVRSALLEGGAFFGSRVSISLYTALVPLVLGWIAGPAVLAHFNLADKLRSAAQSLLTPLSQALFPRLSYLVSQGGDAAYTLIKRSALVVTFIAGSASVTLWLLAEWLVVLVGGLDFAPAAQVLRWLAPLPLVIGLSNLLGVQIMLPHRLNRAFNTILTSAAAISLLLIWPMVLHLGALGAAQTMLLVELWVTGSMTVTLWRYGYLSALKWRNT